MSSIKVNKEDISSVIASVNQTLLSDEPKKLENSLKVLFLISYDTSRFIHSVLHTVLPFNPTIMHQHECKHRAKLFKKQHLISRKVTYDTFTNKGFLLTPSMSSHIGLGELIGIKTQKTREFKRLQQKTAKMRRGLSAFSKRIDERKKKVEIPEQTAAKQKTINIQELTSALSSVALQAHRTNNHAPICVDPKNPEKALYTPQTIIKVRNTGNIINDSKIGKHVLEQLNYVANLSDQERGDYVDSMMRQEIITKKYCKKTKFPEVLIGQKGIFAVQDIPAYTVLGYYSGLYFTDLQDAQTYARESGAGYSLYVFGFPNTDVPRVSGYQYGNDLTLVNASTNYTGTAYNIARQLYFDNSVTPLYTKSLEYPDKAYVEDPDKYDLVAYVTKQDIKAGDQILTDYGIKYWRKKNPNFTTATMDEITQAYRSFAQSKNKKINKKFRKK